MQRSSIRDSAPGDWPMIEALYRAAFPNEDLLPLVHALLREPATVLSLAATIGPALAGHAMFTACALTGSDDRAALLGPLAVIPRWQRRGVGSALVSAGLNRLRRDRITRVYVLGDPAYYGRFGFCRAGDTGAGPPYPLPAPWRSAWQSLALDRTAPASRGALRVPRPWRSPALWRP